MEKRIVFLLINSSENDNISIYDLLKKQLKILHFLKLCIKINEKRRINMITKPKGTYDIYGSEAKKWQYVNDIIDAFCSYYRNNSCQIHN